MAVPLPKGCLDLTGDKYGKLTALSFAGRVNNASSWKCQCECGHIGDYLLGNLRGRHTSKCVNCRTKHGQSNTRLYSLWNKYKHSKTLCKTWLDFNEFSKAVTDHPGQFLRRHDLSQPHSSLNSYWGDRIQHLPHPPGTHGRFYSYDGLTLNLLQWSERLSVSRERIRQLVNEHGSVEEIIRHRANQRGVTMAEVVESFPGFKGGNYKYQPEKYATGDIWRLQMGEDIVGTIKSFRTSCHIYARKNNLVVKTRIIDDTIFVKFKPRDEG